MKIEGQPKELTDFILSLNQSVISPDNIIRAIEDRIEDAIEELFPLSQRNSSDSTNLASKE